MRVIEAEEAVSGHQVLRIDVSTLEALASGRIAKMQHLLLEGKEVSQSGGRAGDENPLLMPWIDSVTCAGEGFQAGRSAGEAPPGEGACLLLCHRTAWLNGDEESEGDCISYWTAEPGGEGVGAGGGAQPSGRGKHHQAGRYSLDQHGYGKYSMLPSFTQANAKEAVDEEAVDEETREKVR